ncbi:MAG: hypothetical protein QNK49_03590 [Porticoccus sp.]
MKSPKTYTAYNYAPYNAAVDNQLETQRELIAEARSRRKLIQSKWVFYITACISMLICVGALVYWLLNNKNTINSATPSQADTIKETSNLKQIAETATEIYSIDTSYTVFNKTVMASGEIVVTGKDYEPDSLDTPVDQYCYLDSSTSTQKIITELAIVEYADMEVKTTDQRLINDGIPLCQFQLPDN